MSIVLVAASGLAREVLALLGTTGSVQVHVLDDDPVAWGTDLGGVEVIGGLECARDFPDAQFLVCAGRGAARRGITRRLADVGVDGDRYATVVHPGIELPPACTVGHGSILLAGARLTANVTVGEHVVVMPNATLTHDDVVEDYATICAGVALGGYVHVGEAAYLGMNSSVRERVVVGAGSTLGMGAALVLDLPAAETWVGVPARPIPSPRHEAVS